MNTFSPQFGAFTAVALLLAAGCAHLPVPAIDPAACTYDRCAVWRAGARFLRGDSAERIGTEQQFSAVRIESHLIGNDSAIALATQYRSLYARSTLIGVVGVPVVIFGSTTSLFAGAAGGTNSGPVLAVVAITALGYGLLWHASSLRGRANERIGRAMLLYNRSLPRIPVNPDSVSGAGPRSIEPRKQR